MFNTLNTQFMETTVVEGSKNILPFFYMLCSVNEVTLRICIFFVRSLSALAVIPR